MALTEKEREWLECHFNKVNDKITKILVEIAVLKVKSGIWGVIGGTIPVVILIAIYCIFQD